MTFTCDQDAKDPGYDGNDERGGPVAVQVRAEDEAVHLEKETKNVGNR